jgi:hypothetical protein
MNCGDQSPGRRSHAEPISWLRPLCGLRLWFSGNGNVNVGALFELHIIAVFVSERIFNTEIATPVVGPVNSDLCPFRLTWTSRPDDLCQRFRASWPLAVLEFARDLDSVLLFLRIWPCVASPSPS